MVKNHKKCLLILMIVSCSVLLSGCGVTDALYYLFGSSGLVKKQPDYQEYQGENGLTLTYDASLWETPYMIQDDTISVVTGTSFNYTAVLFQTTDSYTDFITQSSDELKAETTCVEYEYTLDVPGADTVSIRLDCGSYQSVFSEITYPDTETIYMTAATYSGNLEKIEELAKNIRPSE